MKLHKNMIQLFDYKQFLHILFSILSTNVLLSPMVFIASFQLLICGFSLLTDKVVQETAGIIGVEIGNFLVLIQLNIFHYEAICLRFCHLFFLGY